MGTEHRFRDERGVDADVGAGAFDWVTPAEELQIPLDEARAIYEEVLRRALYPGSPLAQDLYLEWLAAWEPGEPLAAPGRHALTMRIGQRHRREPARRSRTPGKRPLTASLDRPRSLPAEARDGARRSAHREARPGSEDFTRELQRFLRGGAGEPGLARATDAAAHAPAAHDPAAHDAEHASPAQAPGWSWTLLQGGAQGRPLPGDVAARLGPHVGAEAAGAARLHTDDTADLVAAAHHARAVALGDQIFFARGEYAPGTERGDELLAHELTHVAQAQRGDLTRAAAKGIDSGATLDPAEAEADLRARLAVLQLHAPEGAPPALAAPAGQPATDGDRAAMLAAQQQRLELVNQDAPADAAVPEAPTASPQAPAAHPAPEMTAAPAPPSSDSAYVKTFDAPPSKQATEMWAQAGAEATTEAAADRADFEAGLEPLPVVLDGSEAPPAAAGGGPEHAPEAPPEAGAPPPATTPTPTPVPPPTTAAAASVETLQPSADPAQMEADARAALAALPTTLPEGMPTEPGTAPLTDLAGQADPARALGDHHHAVGEGATAFEAEKEKVITGPGPAQVQPVVLDEQLEVPALDDDGPMPELPTVEGMAKLEKWSLPAEVQGAFDEVARPKMEASLAEAKAKMLEAQTQRDTERTRAVDDAHEKVKLAHEDADKQQQTKVAETRTQITNHQSTTLLKQEQEVKKLEQQSGEKKKGAVGKIQERLSADQAKVEADYADAKTRADDERRKGEEEVARKKQEAEDEANRDRNFFEQIGDAICDAVEAIAEEIDEAITAIGEAIGQILDAVKEAACALIDAARDFVCQALTEFGDWLKSAVTALIGSVFPELAAELNRLIDEAVTAATDAVNAIADGLKAAVTALCDGLKAAIQAALAAFRAAVQAAVTFVQALVTGDWSLVAKMILDGVLQLLGIDPAAFYALVGSAQDSLEKIVEDPGAFVGHLVDAVKLGFDQFGTNFWTHLQAGVVQWLFGTFAEAGIQMPAQFDIAGIFDLVLQVLGLTWDRLRVKVVDLIGEENTERLEFVAGYIEALITGGLSGLWEKVQQDLSNLWDMVIGGIKDWLIETVVQQAIIKIATMWNPAGALIQLIQTAWNTYQWLKENAQRIFGLVQAVVDSIANIVAGDISGAANWIEQSLAQLVPIAISLFANLIGLGGLADHIRGIIERVQATVDNAIDKLIERVKALFTGKGGEESPDQGEPDDTQIGKTVTFTAGGSNAETHSTWVEVQGTRALVMVASNAMEAEAQLELIERLGVKTKKQREMVGAAKAQIDETKAAAQRRLDAKEQGGDTTEAELALEIAQDALAVCMKNVFDIYMGGFSDWFEYQLNETAGLVQHPIGPVNSGGELNPPPEFGDHYENAYIANVPTTSPANVDASNPILPPARIGQVYSSAFLDPQDLKNRFALVIGVNTFEDLKDTAQQRVQANVSAGVGKDFPWSVIGFTWLQDWRTKDGSSVSIDEVRTYFNDLPSERQLLALEYEKRNLQKSIPYGEIRDAIKTSTITTNFDNILSERARRVFLQVGDGDVMSLNPNPDDLPYFDRYDQLLDAAASDILAHAAKATGGQGPIIASGGYQLELRIGPGGGGAADIRTVLGAKLDMKVRTAMASVDAGTVYFPEPNFIIEITPDTLRATFGNADMESRRLAQSAIDAVAKRKPLLLWNTDAAIVTTTPSRMEAVPGGHMKRLWEDVKQITPADLLAIFNTAQNHAQRRMWCHQFADSYRLNARWALGIVGELYSAAFPVDSDKLSTFNKVLDGTLASWAPDEAVLQEIASRLAGQLPNGIRLGDEASPDTSGSTEELVDRMINVATTAGSAVQEWLLQLAENVKNGQGLSGL